MVKDPVKEWDGVDTFSALLVDLGIRTHEEEKLVKMFLTRLDFTSDETG